MVTHALYGGLNESKRVVWQQAALSKMSHFARSNPIPTDILEARRAYTRKLRLWEVRARVL
jgi:hypothetical protein